MAGGKPEKKFITQRFLKERYLETGHVHHLHGVSQLVIVRLKHALADWNLLVVLSFDAIVEPGWLAAQDRQEGCLNFLSDEHVHIVHHPHVIKVLLLL